MNFDHLKLFKDIVHTRSLSRGAALNQISQSAASQHIQEIEKRFGVPLLDRSTRPFTLLPAGRLYYEMVRDVLRRKEEFDVALEHLRGEVEGTVRVAAIYSVGLSDMSRLEQEFSRRSPKAQLHVEYLRPEKVYDAVLTDQADLGMLSYPEPTRVLAAIPWRREEMAVAAAPNHPLAQRKVISPADLRNVAFVAFDEDLPIRKVIDHYLKAGGADPDVSLHFDNIQMIMEAVALGAGVSILPARAMQANVERGRLVAIPLAPPGLFRPLGVIHRRRKKFNRAAQSFLELLEESPDGNPQANSQQ